MKHKLNSVEILLTVKKDQRSTEEVEETLKEELEDPDFGDGLGYALVKNYNLDQIEIVDEDKENYYFRIVYVY